MARRKAKRRLYYCGNSLSLAELERDFRRLEEFRSQREIQLSYANGMPVGFGTSTDVDFISAYCRILAAQTVVVDPSRTFVLTPDSTL